MAGYFEVPPGDSLDVHIDYVTDGQREEPTGIYRLFWQKQAGLDARPLSLTARWPDGGLATYRDSPATDRWISVPPPLATNPRVP